MTPLSGVRLSVILFLLVILACLAGACASNGHIQHDFFKETTATPLKWPPPPQKPRVHLIGSIEDTAGMGARGSFMKKALSRIFGEEKNPSRLLRPYGVFAVNDRIYVTDPGSGKLHVYDRGRKKYFSVERRGADSLISPIGVAVEENGQKVARRRKVEVGQIYNRSAEIKSGLQAGDKVITTGYQDLNEGDLISYKM